MQSFRDRDREREREREGGGAGCCTEQKLTGVKLFQ